ncbi:MAG: hypothetical protein ACJ769_04220 [Chloroflexota bacterium]
MGDSKRPARRPLTVGEAQAITDDLRHGRRDRIEDVRFPDRFQVQVGTIRGVTFANCVLWLTVGGGMFSRGLMEECTFRDVDLDPLTVFGSDMRANTFERVTFGIGAMGGIADSRIEGGSFTDCRFADFGFRKATLDGVRIDGGRMDRVLFDACTFVDVQLASALRDVTLLRPAFDRSDASASDAVDVTFTEWRTADIRLPARRTGFFVTPAAASEVVGSVLPDLSVAFRERLSADVIRAGYDVVAVSERFFTNALGASPGEASLLVDALYPRRLDDLGQVEAR